MNTYNVHFRSYLASGTQEIDAKTPKQALAIGRKIAKERPSSLDLDHYETSPINEIEVCDDEDDSLAVWLDDDLQLRLSARDLLEAAELVVARWEQGDLADAVRGLAAAVAAAKGGAS